MNFLTDPETDSEILITELHYTTVGPSCTRACDWPVRSWPMVLWSMAYGWSTVGMGTALAKGREYHCFRGVVEKADSPIRLTMYRTAAHGTVVYSYMEVYSAMLYITNSRQFL